MSEKLNACCQFLLDDDTIELGNAPNYNASSSSSIIFDLEGVLFLHVFDQINYPVWISVLIIVPEIDKIYNLDINTRRVKYELPV